MTLNSSESMLKLFQTASSQQPENSVTIAEQMREVGLKCIGFNGIPRTINMLNSFRDGLPQDVTSQLITTPSRQTTSQNVEEKVARGRELWDSIYRPFETKLPDKLALAHPDLPVHILNCEYPLLLNDPASHASQNRPGRTGRILTSIIAIACLRAQSGVGPQVISHVFGLRKALDDGTWKDDDLGEQSEETTRWLASDEGNMWIIEQVDAIVAGLSEGMGSNFAPGMKAKL